MKPTNKKAYNWSLIKFFLMWTITTALIVFAILEIFGSPELENERLKREVADLKADSIQQHILETTVTGITSTLTNLDNSYNTDTLQKLKSYPISNDLADGKMGDKLSNMSEKIAQLVEKNSTNKDDVQKRLEDCQRDLATRDGELRLKQAELDLCERGTNTYQPPITPQYNNR